MGWTRPLLRVLDAIRRSLARPGRTAIPRDESASDALEQAKRQLVRELLHDAMLALDSAERCFLASRQAAASDWSEPSDFGTDASDSAYMEGVLDAERARALASEARQIAQELPTIDWAFVEPEVASLRRRLEADLWKGPTAIGGRPRPAMVDFVGRQASFDALQQVRSARRRLRRHLREPGDDGLR